MNKFELVVYNLVKNNPTLKQLIVDMYQTVLSCIPQKKLISSFPVFERQGFFYGFHDKTPFSTDGTYLLAHKNLIGNRSVRVGDTVEIGFLWA
jgi:hypothetical protein